MQGEERVTENGSSLKSISSKASPLAPRPPELGPSLTEMPVFIIVRRFSDISPLTEWSVATCIFRTSQNYYFECQSSVHGIYSCSVHSPQSLEFHVYGRKLHGGFDVVLSF